MWTINGLHLKRPDESFEILFGSPKVIAKFSWNFKRYALKCLGCFQVWQKCVQSLLVQHSNLQMKSLRWRHRKAIEIHAFILFQLDHCSSLYSNYLNPFLHTVSPKFSSQASARKIQYYLHPFFFFIAFLQSNLELILRYHLLQINWFQPTFEALMLPVEPRLHP